MRKMATIRMIDDIQPIPGADAIECAVVGGWKVVIKKGEYIIGDFAVYCEIDSWIPTELAPFLSKGKEPREYNGVKGEKLRTVKLRGQVSQGLLLPLWVIRNSNINYDWYQPEIGTDVSENLGIQKWDPPVSPQLAGMAKGNWPSAIPKTDQERIQNLTREWNSLKQMSYEVTEKMEGSSMTCALIDGEFIVCSRNINLKETEGNTFWKVARQENIEHKMRSILLTGTNLGYMKIAEHEIDGNVGSNFAVQGELIGEGIQGNHYEIKGHRFMVFDIIDLNTGKAIEPTQRRKLVEVMGLESVPVLEKDYIPFMDIDEVLELADNKSRINPNKLREGVVFKSNNSEDHWKAVSNKYLERQKD